MIGAVGRLEPQKRFDLLLDAFAALRGEWPLARLVIVGDGSERDAARGPRGPPWGRPQRVASSAIASTSPTSTTASTCSCSRPSTRARPTPCSKPWRWRRRSWPPTSGARASWRCPIGDALIVPPHDVPALVAAMTTVLGRRRRRTRTRARRSPAHRTGPVVCRPHAPPRRDLRRAHGRRTAVRRPRTRRTPVGVAGA